MRPENANDKPPPDFRQELTDSIVKLLESGTAPWQQPWKADLSMPMNPTTGKPYRGGNVIALMVASMVKGYGDSRWMTFRQAEEKGWHVRKGEKGSKIEFWEAKPGDKAPDANDDDKRSRLIHRTYTVFNAQQIEGIPPIIIEPRKPFEVIEAGEQILANSGATIKHGGGQAYYHRKGDYVQLPQKETFVDAPAYYATAAHELAHWSGHPSRLNRDTLNESYKFGDQNYAKEELSADLASCFMAAEKGLPYNPEHTAAYVQSWIKALKNDKNEIFRAASAASKACDYILDKNRAVGAPAEEGPYAAAVTESRQTSARAL